MILLLKFILANAGFAYLVTKAGITEPFRELWLEDSFIKKLFECPLCFGFWSSWGVHYLVYRDTNIFDMAYHSFIGSITAYIIYLLIVQLKSVKL